VCTKSSARGREGRGMRRSEKCNLLYLWQFTYIITKVYTRERSILKQEGSTVPSWMHTFNCPWDCLVETSEEKEATVLSWTSRCVYQTNGYVSSSQHKQVFKCLTLWRRNYFFFILAHPVYKMWIIQKPNKSALWNKLHFEEKRTESIEHV